MTSNRLHNSGTIGNRNPWSSLQLPHEAQRFGEYRVGWVIIFECGKSCQLVMELRCSRVGVAASVAAGPEIRQWLYIGLDRTKVVSMFTANCKLSLQLLPDMQFPSICWHFIDFLNSLFNKSNFLSPYYRLGPRKLPLLFAYLLSGFICMISITSNITLSCKFYHKRCGIVHFILY